MEKKRPGKQYGAGPDKIAYMCGVSKAAGRKIADQYDRQFPEAKALLIITCIVAVPFVVTWFATKFVFKMLAREMRREE